MKIIQKYIVIASVVIILSGMFSGCGWNTTYIPPVSITHSPLEATTTPPDQISTSTTYTGLPLSSEEQKSWKTYRDEKNGFELYYPPELNFVLFEPEGDKSTGVVLSFPTSSYQGSNLRDAKLIVAAQEGPCLPLPGHGGTVPQTKLLPSDMQVGTQKFTLQQQENGAAGTLYETDEYYTETQASCYKITLVLAKVDLRNVAGQSPREFDREEVERIFLKVISTFKFVK